MNEYDKRQRQGEKGAPCGDHRAVELDRPASHFNLWLAPNRKYPKQQSRHAITRQMFKLIRSLFYSDPG
jgi:hypothetical protein